MARTSDRTEEKNELIDFLIDNGEATGWSEDDREELETLALGSLRRCVSLAEVTIENAAEPDADDEEDMPPRSGKMSKARRGKKKMKAVTNKEVDDEDEDEEEEDEEPARNSQKKSKASKKKGGSISVLQTNTENEEELTSNQEDQESLEEFLAKAPPSAREMLTNGVRFMERQKTDLVNAIFNHEANKFTKEWLAAQTMPVLEGLSSFVSNGKRRQPSFVGAGGGFHSSSPLRNGHQEEALPLPTMNFDGVGSTNTKKTETAATK